MATATQVTERSAGRKPILYTHLLAAAFALLFADGMHAQALFGGCGVIRKRTPGTQRTVGDSQYGYPLQGLYRVYSVRKTPLRPAQTP